MKHIGDITKISGFDVEPVNVIIGGSPCQDLSIAGKRAGLSGERSGLFMEQLRIIKEMRKADEQRGRTGSAIRPRFMVWENVPGAFSSNKGADFGAVLQETAKVIYNEAPVIPMPKRGWPTSGCLQLSLSMDRRCSIAWRVFDAQFWGVPQRRRRIALVADFGGSSAPEILFERKGMSGDFETIGKTGETVTTDIEDSTGRNDSILAEKIAYTLKIRSGCEGGGKGALVQEDKSATLSTLQDQTLFAPTNKFIPPTYCIQGNAIDRSEKSGCNGKGWTEDVSYTLNTADRPAVSYAIENHPNDSRCKLSDGNTVQTLSSRMGTGGGNTPMILECYSQDAYDKYSPNSVAPTIKNSGGVYGGGSETLIVERTVDVDESKK